MENEKNLNGETQETAGKTPPAGSLPADEPGKSEIAGADTGAGTAENTEKACPSIFDKPDYSTQKPPKKRKIGRQARTIAICVAVCLALVAGVFGVNRLWPKTDTEDSASSSSSDESAKYIYDYSAYATSNEDTDALKLGGVSKITAVNGDTVMELGNTMSTTSSVDPETLQTVESDSLVWSFSSISGMDIENVVFNNTYIGFIPNTLLHLQYSSVYAEDKNAEISQGGMTYYEECGFNNSTVSQTVEFADGSSIKVKIGDSTPTDKNRFVCLEASAGKDSSLAGVPQKDDRIYSVSESELSYFMKTPEYFVNTQLIEALKAETSYDTEGNEVSDSYFMSGTLAYFEDITVNGTNFANPLQFKTGDVNEPPYVSIYRMLKPYEQNVDTDAIDTLLAPLSGGFLAEKCLTLKPTAQQLSEYGLASPACNVTYVVKGETYNIRIGNQVDSAAVESSNASSSGTSGTYYAVMVNDNPSVFAMSADSVKFVSMDEPDYANSMVYSCNIDQIKSMTITMNGESTKFDLTHSESDSSDSSESELTVATGGRTVDTATFRQMYVDILSLTSFAHVTDGKDAAQPYLTITLTYEDYDRTDTLRFSPYTDRRYFMSLNGHGTTVVLSTGIDSFVEGFNSVMS